MEKENEIPCIQCILLAACKSKTQRPIFRILYCDTLLDYFDSLPVQDEKLRKERFEFIKEFFKQRDEEIE
jgi:hypothetical protein